MKRLDRAKPVPDMSPMPRFFPRSIRRAASGIGALLGLVGCSATPPPSPVPVAAQVQRAPAPAAPRAVSDPAHPVMLGIDVLEAQGFAAIKGKSIALLTHPAGVNMHDVSTIDILRRAPGVRLVALFSTEHGIRGEYPASINYPDHIDARTGLPVYSLYNGINRGKPSRAQLKGIDTVVIDLQDIGSRSHIFIAPTNV